MSAFTLKVPPSGGIDPPALACALKMLGMGLWPVPISPIDDPGPSAGKRPMGEGWGLTRHTPDSLHAFYRANPRAGVGLKLGKDGGVIDLEVDDPATGGESVVTLFMGEDVPTRGWRSNRGPHRLFRWDDRLARYGKPILKIADLPGLEIRLGSADPGGKQFQSVIPPSPLADGTPRKWNGMDRIAELPESFFVTLDPILLPNPKTADPGNPFRITIPIRPESDGWSAEERARAYLARLPEAIEHQRGHDRLYHVACVLVDGFALSYAQALPILRQWNEVHAIPPESDKQLEHKLIDALKNTARTGHLLNAERPDPSPTNGWHPAGTSPAQPAEDAPIVAREWPDPPREAAYRGIAGDFVRTLEEHTESDPIAILVQLLVGFGNLVGRHAYWAVEADRHYPNLFGAMVGASGKARKGTSWGHVRNLLQGIDPDWADARIMGGLSSGEGLTWHVRDQVTKREPIKEKGKTIDYHEVIIDDGVADKRLLSLEPELASVMRVMTRDANTLSATMRHAWDSGNLRSLAKHSPGNATGAHISIIGHITRDELQKLMTDVEAGNGFGNRFLWVCVRRSKSLPFGGDAHALQWAPLLNQFTHAAALARSRGGLSRDDRANALWLAHYDRLSQGQPGLLGSILGRAEAQAMRLALIYALLDCDGAIRYHHLDSALALWDYAEASARYVFGDAMGDDVADAILSALRAAPGGMTRTDIRGNVFSRNTSSAEIARALGRLLESGLARREKVATGGRPAELWLSNDKSQGLISSYRVTPEVQNTPVVPENVLPGLSINN